MRLAGLLFLAIPLLAGQAQAAPCFLPSAPGAHAEGVVKPIKRRHGNGAPLAGYVIKLKTPACLDDPEALDDVSQVREIHVVPATKRDAVILQRSIGQRVRVTGSAMAAHTSYHFAPIVLLDSQVRRPGAKGAGAKGA